MQAKLTTAWVLLIPALSLSAAEPAAPTRDALRAAVDKSLPLLVKAGAGYRAERDCFGCHNITFPLLAFTAARSAGFTVDEAEIKAQTEFTAKSLGKNKENYRKGRGQGGNVATAGYGLWTLELGGHKADDVSTAVAEYLLIADKDRDHWFMTARRPPTEYSHFTAVFIALRGLRAYGVEGQKDRIAARTARVRDWLVKAEPKETEDRAFRLLALKEAGADAAEIKKAADDLLSRQRAIGGWGQTDEMESDAYATATAMVALHRGGGIPTDHPAYRKGLEFLLSSQQPDGSWHVKSRSKPFQKYFESGYPHGKDQFVSVSAGGWATAAIADACRK